MEIDELGTRARVAARRQCATVASRPPAACADPVLRQCITAAHRAAFEADGFVVIQSLIGIATCVALQERLEKVLRGNGDLGLPDKAPTFRPETRCKKGKVPPALGGPSKRTLQLINCWKADSEFRALVRSPRLGEVVATLAGWNAGARVANDQIWAKPPGARALSFHRDSAYFDFVPADVVTVWIALDDMDHELGPLEYVHGSHKWCDALGSAAQFFVRGGGGHRDHLLAAAALETPPLAERDLVISEVGVRAGGCGIHNGRTWHGSGGNSSRTKPRRGLGVHFVPANAVFRDVSSRTTLAARQAFGAPAASGASGRGSDSGSGSGGDLATSASAALDDALFPVTWRPAS